MANIRVQLNAVGMPAIASVRDRIAVRVNYTTVPKTNVNPSNILRCHTQRVNSISALIRYQSSEPSPGV